ncbi:MAG: hypothetical protein ACRCWU_00800 [Metamycoplasmataceae bacterium]
MKLWFGSSLLTILPIVTVFSCSSMFEKIDDKINIEELEKPSITTKDITSVDAIARINNAKTPQEKHDALTFFANVPQLPIEFDFEVLSALIDNERVNVSIKIFEIKNKNNFKNVVLKITGFNAELEADLDSEIKKFNISNETTKPNSAWEEVVSLIETAKTQSEKVEALKCFAIIPIIDWRFDFLILEAMVNNSSSLNTSVDVRIRVFEINNPINKEDVVFQITGLTTRLDIQASLFKKPALTTKPETASEVLATIIQSAQNSIEKLNVLRNYVNIPIIDEYFEFEILLARVNGRVKNVVDVIVRVFEINNPVNKEDVVFQITGLTTRLDIQASKFYNPIETIEPNSNCEEVVSLIETDETQVGKIETLKRFANIPILEDGFDFLIFRAMVNSEVDNEVDVVIRVFEINNQENFVNVYFKITGFKSSSLLN